MWGKTNKFILTLSINWLTLMPEGVHGASAGRSFGYAQDDATGEAEEAAGVHRASADGSFASLRMTAGGRCFFFTPTGRLYGFLNDKRKMLFVSHSLFITSHPERSRRIYQR